MCAGFQCFVFEKELNRIQIIKKKRKTFSPNCVLGFEAEEKTGGEVFDVVHTPGNIYIHTPGGKQHGQEYHYDDDDDDDDDDDE